jgi:hypothetical protein
VAWTIEREMLSAWGKEGERGKRRTIVVTSLNVDALVAELLVVELDIVLVLAEAVEEEDVFAVVCETRGRVSPSQGKRRGRSVPS